MKKVVDLPEKHLRLFIQLVLANNGRLSAAKRDRFAMLSDDEVERLARLVREELLPFGRS